VTPVRRSLRSNSWISTSSRAKQKSRALGTPGCAPFRYRSRLPEGPRVASDSLDADTAAILLEAGRISQEASAELNNAFESLKRAQQQLEVMRGQNGLFED